MEPKCMPLFCCVILVAIFSMQLINTVVIQRFTGYAVFRNNSGNLEYLVVKPTGTTIWTLPNEATDNGTAEVDTALKVLERYFGLKLDDIKEIPEYFKNITEKIKDDMNLTSYRVAELRDPFHPIAISPVFTDDYRWLPFHDLVQIRNSPIRNALKEIEDFLDPVVDI